MRENVKENHYTDEGILLLIKAVSCAVILLLAHFLKTNFIIQLFVYLFLLFQMRKALIEGFEALGKFKPNIASLLLIVSFFSLLHGVASLDEKNSFSFCAIVLVVFLTWEIVLDKYKKEEYYGFFDKVGSLLIVFAFAIMIITVVINLFLRVPLMTAFQRVLLVPVFICPTALVAVKPLSTLLFEKLLNGKGVIIRSAEAAEKIGKSDEMIIEQKGFLTSKEYTLYDIYSTDGDKIGLLSAALAIESHFSHPFSYAIIAASLRVDISVLQAYDCAEICGKGVSGTVGENKYFLGNKKLMRDKKVTIPQAILAIDFDDKTPIFVAKNGKFAGFLVLYNKTSDGAEDALKLIGQMGIRRLLLSDGNCEKFKKSIDIFLPSREKVLQEFKKGAKIKAITVTEKPISKADVTVLSANNVFEEADIYADSLVGTAAAAVYGKKLYRLMKKAVIISCLISVTFSVLAAFGAFYVPLMLSVLTALPLVFLTDSLRYELPQFSSSEDDIMFGKINYTMTIKGMSCTHCSARVKTALESLKGVSADVSLEEKTARIKCPASTTAETLEKAVTDVGFTVVSTERV